MNNKIRNLIDTLDLQSHPEGGYFKETYRSEIIIPVKDHEQDRITQRSLFTEILYLLPQSSFSSFHKIKSAESWHFFKGSPVTIVMLNETTGTADYITLDNEKNFQAVVPAGIWFAAFSEGKYDYSLTGCTVSPGFDFDDFTIADRTTLLNIFPENLHEIIRRYTREQPVA